MGVVVRPATVADIDGIHAVAEAAWYAAHEPIVGTDAVESFLAEHYDPASFEGYLDVERRLLAVAVDADDVVVGFVSAGPDDEASGLYHLGRLYVIPDRWGEGIGRRLLTYAEDRILEQGGDRVALGVMAENDRAVAFYEAAGYYRVGEFYDDRVDTAGYTYEKAL